MTLKCRIDSAQIVKMTQQAQSLAKLTKLSATTSTSFYPTDGFDQAGMIWNPVMEPSLTLCQRFQSLKLYINTELRGIRAAFPRETEHMANEIDFSSFLHQGQPQIQ